MREAYEAQMRNGFGSQFESLIRRRFQERDKNFRASLVAVKQEHNRRGILRSSMTVVAMHAEVEREFKESATECVKTLVDAMENRTTALPVPGVRKILRLCTDALTERKAALDATYRSASATILASLSNSGISAPYRSLSDSFVQLQCENASVELRTKKRGLFWLKVNRMLKLLTLVGALVAGAAYLKRVEIAEMWMSLLDRFETPAHDASKNTEKTEP